MCLVGADDFERDYSEAAKWLAKAAEQGNAPAQNSLGVLYREGRGVPQDSQKAFGLFQQAAERGDAKAQANLGSAYYHGGGVERDPVQALVWLKLGTEQEEATASNLLNDLGTELTKEQMAEGLRKLAEARVKFPKRTPPAAAR